MINLSDSEYENIFNSIEKFTKGALHLFALKNLDIKEIIIRNFIAKSFSLLNSILLLQQSRQFGESTILYRTLVERFVYLKYIIDNKLYKEFDDWSYVKNFERRNNFRSYPEFNNDIKRDFLKDEKSQIERYERLKKEKTKWIEPDIEAYLKKIDLKYLYKLSYDLGSSYVHPRADEGHFDTMRLTGLKNENEWIYKPILHNSILLNVAILQIGLLNVELFNEQSVVTYCEKILKHLSNEEHIQNLDTLTKTCTIGLIKGK